MSPTCPDCGSSDTVDIGMEGNKTIWNCGDCGNDFLVDTPS